MKIYFLNLKKRKIKNNNLVKNKNNKIKIKK